MSDYKRCNNCAYESAESATSFTPCNNCSNYDREKPSLQLSAKADVVTLLAPTPHPSASELLHDAANTLISRGVDYDKPTGERSMAKTVVVFNLLTDNNLTEAEGWQFMKCLKQVRNWSGDKRHADSMVGDIAYSALLAECATHV